MRRMLWLLTTVLMTVITGTLPAQGGGFGRPQGQDAGRADRPDRDALRGQLEQRLERLRERLDGLRDALGRRDGEGARDRERPVEGRPQGQERRRGAERATQGQRGPIGPRLRRLLLLRIHQRAELRRGDRGFDRGFDRRAPHSGRRAPAGQGGRFGPRHGEGRQRGAERAGRPRAGGRPPAGDRGDRPADRRSGGGGRRSIAV